MRTSLAPYGFALFFMLSCTSEEVLVETPTQLQGEVVNRQDGTPISDYYVALQKLTYVSGFGGGWSTTVLDSTRTDSKGYFYFQFDYQKGVWYTIDYYSGNTTFSFVDLLPKTEITPGINNVWNIEVWNSVVLVVHLRVIGNENPPLEIFTKHLDDVGMESELDQLFVISKDTDTVLYVPAKPDTTLELLFRYEEGNGELHTYLDTLHSTGMDSVNLEVTINCADF